MDYEMRKGTPEDYEDIIDFASLVFSVNFPARLGKLYSGHPECAKYHHLITEAGRIKALVGSFPLEFTVAGKTLQSRGIGTVSVHPYARSRGYMKLLLAATVEEAKAEGVDFMCLGGQRQRYEYFGFGMAATALSFIVTPTNRRHGKAVSTQGFELLPLAENREYLSACQKLQSVQPVAGTRTVEDFGQILECWDCDGFVVLENGEFLGYISLQKDRTAVQEIYLTRYDSALKVVYRIVDFCGKNVTFRPTYAQQELAEALSFVAEQGGVNDGEMINVLNYPRFIEAYLTLKGQTCGILDGSYVIEVKEVGRYEIRVEDGIVSVRETTKTPNITLPHAQMMTRLFSITHVFQQHSAIEKSWFPIPVVLPQPDMT